MPRALLFLLPFALFFLLPASTSDVKIFICVQGADRIVFFFSTHFGCCNCQLSFIVQFRMETLALGLSENTTGVGCCELAVIVF